MNTDIALLILRLFAGLRIVYGVIDNVINWDRMLEFATFLQGKNFPFPLLCAVTSVYVQLVCGILICIGLFTRLAAAILFVNFAIALIMVHRNDSIEVMTPALSLLIISLALVLCSSGRFSISGRLADRIK